MNSARNLLQHFNARENSTNGNENSESSRLGTIMTGQRAPRVYGSILRMLLREDILRAVGEGHLVIDPFDEQLAQTDGSYDLRIGQIASYPKKDLYTAEDRPTSIKSFDTLELAPDQSILFLSLERIEFPDDIIAEIYLRSRYAQLLGQNWYLGKVKRGWEGHLVLEIRNDSSDRVIIFNRGDPIVNLDIFQIDPDKIANLG